MVNGEMLQQIADQRRMALTAGFSRGKYKKEKKKAKQDAIRRNRGCRRWGNGPGRGQRTRGCKLRAQPSTP